MDKNGFQDHCTMLLERVDKGLLNDGDLDTFADIIANVLACEDFRAPGTAYDRLDRRVSEIYEKAMIQPMPPLIARLYQICRGFDMYRPRPMTELEIQEVKNEGKQNVPVKYALLVEVKDGLRTLANCWWENQGTTDEAASLIAVFAQNLQDRRSDKDIVAAFAACGAGFEMIDEAARELYPDIPVVNDRETGIIGIGDGMARNVKRRGHIIKVDLSNGSIYADNYMIWGLSYFNETHENQIDDVSALPVWQGDMTYYLLENAGAVADRIHAMPEVFAKPNSPNAVVTKFVSDTLKTAVA